MIKPGQPDRERRRPHFLDNITKTTQNTVIWQKLRFRPQGTRNLEIWQNLEIWRNLGNLGNLGNLAPDPKKPGFWTPENPDFGPRNRPDFGVPGTPEILAGTPDFVKSGKKRPKSGSVLLDTTETIVAESVLFPRIWDPGKPGFRTPETPDSGPRPGPQICRIRPDPGPGPDPAGTGTLPGNPGFWPNPRIPDFPDFPDSQYNPEPPNFHNLCFINLNNYTKSQDGPYVRFEIGILTTSNHHRSTPHAC